MSYIDHVTLTPPPYSLFVVDAFLDIAKDKFGYRSEQVRRHVDTG